MRCLKLFPIISLIIFLFFCYAADATDVVHNTQANLTTGATFVNVTYNTTYNALMQNVTLGGASNWTAAVLDSGSTTTNWTYFNYTSTGRGLEPTETAAIVPTIDYTGLIALYDFDTPNITYQVDKMSGLYNLTNLNTNVIAAGLINNSANFSGATQGCWKVPGNGTDLYRSNGTIMFWMKAEAYNSGLFAIMGIMGTSAATGEKRRVQIIAQATGNISFKKHSTMTTTTVNMVGRGTASNTITKNEWEFYAITWGSSTTSNDIDIYVNGVISDVNPEVSGTYAGYSPSNQPLIVGSQYAACDSKGGINGSIDDLSFWSRQLSQAEIQNIYVRGASEHNISIRNCSSADCSDGTWQQYAARTDNTFNLGTSFTGRYFQYMFNFDSLVGNRSARIYNASIKYNSETGTGDSIAPVVYITNISFTTSDTYANIWFNYTDDIAATGNCILYINGVSNATNTTVVNNTQTWLNATGMIASATNYTLQVNCSDGININGSNLIYVSIPIGSVDYVTIVTKNSETQNVAFAVNYTLACGGTGMCSGVNVTINTSATTCSPSTAAFVAIGTMNASEVYSGSTEYTCTNIGTIYFNATIWDSTGKNLYNSTNITILASGGLTPEEHDWLEFLANNAVTKADNMSIAITLVDMFLIVLFIVMGAYNRFAFFKTACFIFAFFELMILLGYGYIVTTGADTTWIVWLNFLLFGIVGFIMVTLTVFYRSLTLMNWDEDSVQEEYDKFGYSKQNQDKFQTFNTRFK